jgi:hypothetical protein
MPRWTDFIEFVKVESGTRAKIGEITLDRIYGLLIVSLFLPGDFTGSETILVKVFIDNENFCVDSNVTI